MKKVIYLLIIALLYVLCACTPSDLKNATVLAANGMVPPNKIVVGHSYEINGGFLSVDQVIVDSVRNGKVYYYYPHLEDATECLSIREFNKSFHPMNKEDEFDN